jgi:hypothetical protein
MQLFHVFLECKGERACLSKDKVIIKGHVFRNLSNKNQSLDMRLSALDTVIIES